MDYLRRNPKSLSPTVQSHHLLTYTEREHLLSILPYSRSTPPLAHHMTAFGLQHRHLAIYCREGYLSQEGSDSCQIFNSSSRSINYKIAKEDTEYSLIGEIYQILCTQLLAILPVVVWQAPCGWLWLPCRPLFISPAGLLSRRPQWTQPGLLKKLSWVVARASNFSQFFNQTWKTLIFVRRASVVSGCQILTWWSVRGQNVNNQATCVRQGARGCVQASIYLVRRHVYHCV